MPFETVKPGEKPVETPPVETPPVETPPAGETPPAETPPAEPAKTFTLTAEELEKEVSKGAARAAAGAREREREKSLKIERENIALKKQLEAGTRPIPPNPQSFANADGEVDHAGFQNAMVQHEDKLFTWRQAQEGVKEAASPATPADESFANWDRGSAAMIEKHKDYDEVISRPFFTPQLATELYASDAGPQIAYFLGNNEGEARRIGALESADMLTEIRRLEKEAPAGAPRRTDVSGAPPPINPVTGTATVERDPEKMTTPEWMAQENRLRLEKIKKAQSAPGG